MIKRWLVEWLNPFLLRRPREPLCAAPVEENAHPRDAAVLYRPQEAARGRRVIMGTLREIVYSALILCEYTNLKLLAQMH